MKGITEIELTDVYTGKAEKYKETNLVTNAMADFFSHNINGMLFTIEGNTNDLNGNSRKMRINTTHLPLTPVSVMHQTMSTQQRISCAAV